MAKKKTMDAGLAYLLGIGFDRIRGKNALIDRWKKTFGSAKAEALWNTWRGLSDSTEDFYAFKNSDPALSRSFSEAFDGDIIRKACNYIDAHKEDFGRTILEIGCDCGYMTGFLAKTFPDARIVAIDRCAEAIEIAKKRIDGMHLSNVEFRAAAPEEIDERFDTVFCMRILHENLKDAVPPFMGEPLSTQLSAFRALTEEYTNRLLSRLNENGTLVVFERDGGDPLLCGWMTRLGLSSCAPDVRTFRRIECGEAGETQPFQAFVCRNGAEGDPAQIADLWLDAYPGVLQEQSLLSGWSALACLERSAGKLLRGVRVFDRQDRQVGRYALYRDKDTDPMLCLFRAEDGEMQLFGLSESRKEEALAYLQSRIAGDRKKGLRIEEIADGEA